VLHVGPGIVLPVPTSRAGPAWPGSGPPPQALVVPILTDQTDSGADKLRPYRVGVHIAKIGEAVDGKARLRPVEPYPPFAFCLLQARPV